MNKTFMQSIRTCYYLQILMFFLKVVCVHYNAIYATFLIFPLNYLYFVKKFHLMKFSTGV